MAKPTEYLVDMPVITAPFGLNEDDAPSQLGPGEFPVLDYLVEWRKRLCVYYPVALTDFLTGTERMVSSFAIADGQVSGPTLRTVIFSTNRMYVSTNGGAISEVTAAGGSTAISVDAGTQNDFYSVTVVNGTLFFAHNGTGPLRQWVFGAATFSDVAAPTGGYHNGTKYKPRFVAAHLNRLLLANDAAGVITTQQYDFVWSVSGTPTDFTNFGSGHTTFVDTPDAISGLSFVGNRVIIYKTETIVTGTPTGDALNPYFFERPFQGTEQNVGNLFAFSLVGDGSVDLFVSRRGVVAFNGSTMTPLGRGVDNKILSTSAASPFTFQGTLVTNSGTNNLLNLYALQISIAGTSNRVYVLNLNTFKWSTLSAGAGFGNIKGIGSFFTSGLDKVLVIGSDVASGSSQQVAQMKLATGSNTIPTNVRAQLQIPPGVYQKSGARQVTIERLGVTYTRTTTTTFPVTWSVDNELAAGSETNQNLYTAGDYAAAENFTWVDILATGRLPFINFKLPSGDGSTSRAWPQIASFALQVSPGDVS